MCIRDRDKIHQKKLEKQRRQYFQNLGVLCFPQTDKPLVSIVIPVYNQFDYTLRCLESILRTCEGSVSYTHLDVYKRQLQWCYGERVVHPGKW